ncbi:hypothetical protein BKA65DRAFT_573509 [Rhexocercosporidium sp. MPI-PUGE-AT-0058]|nr:hypothetical protein BKA65DRAFT_573509 [Rhexocercosporidium sp. MPI-PUGE-AT-0058]
MNVPFELLSCIASELGSNDLANFRLANRACANAAVSLIPRHGISVLNTSSDIKELQDVLQHPGIANNVKNLRVFHVRWPVCSRQEWETHHLLLGGNGRLQHQFPSTSVRQLADKAFSAYQEHISEQESRRYFDEISALYDIFSLLPNLTSIQVSNMHEYLWNPKSNRRYHKLQQSIWLSPFYSSDVTRTIEAVSLASKTGTNMDQLTSFSVLGCFNPDDLHLDPSDTFPHIQTLEIEEFLGCENEKSTRSFLLRFPNLRTLSAKFRGCLPAIGIFESAHWPSLTRLDLRGMWTSELEFANILETHADSLAHFGLHDSSLTDGSWKGLFTKIRDLERQLEITLSGELYGTSELETLDMGSDQVQHQMSEFLHDLNSAWPFRSSV